MTSTTETFTAALAALAAAVDARNAARHAVATAAEKIAEDIFELAHLDDTVTVAGRTLAIAGIDYVTHTQVNSAHYVAPPAYDDGNAGSGYALTIAGRRLYTYAPIQSSRERDACYSCWTEIRAHHPRATAADQRWLLAHASEVAAAFAQVAITHTLADLDA